MACECESKLVLKPEHATIKQSPFMSKPVNLAKISESDYGLYTSVFPEAFEIVKECTCSKKKMDKAEGDTANFMDYFKKK